MLYARAADLVAITHAAFIAFLLVGGFLAWRWPRLVWAHLPAVVLTATVFAFGADCPLTDLEKYFRRQAGERAYRDGFIAHYLLPMVPDGVRTGGCDERGHQHGDKPVARHFPRLKVVRGRPDRRRSLAVGVLRH
jgi:hypothetical protein